MTVASNNPKSEIVSEPRPRVNLRFLDGFRGLAALYVMLFHLYNSEGLPHVLAFSLSWLRFGHYAVSVFIVLSGYCLMLPIARSETGQMQRGTWDFFRRRAKRILPPYYAALVFSLILLRFYPQIQKTLNVRSTDGRWAENFTPGCILAHEFLIHNWFKEWYGSIDGPMWSVATEWQIYFLFPLLLLPIWRRFGNVSVILFGLALGVAPLLILPHDYNFCWARPQYLGLFAMGMVGAAIGFSDKLRDNYWRDNLPWGLFAATGFLTFFSIAFYTLAIKHQGMSAYGLPVSQPWIIDVIVGFSTISTIVFCAHYVQKTPASTKPAILRIFECPWAVGLGAFSYSIYLIHLPILNLMGIVLPSFVISPMLQKALLLFIGVPIIIGLSYLFHLAFERRFMSAPAQKRVENDLQQLSSTNK